MLVYKGIKLAGVEAKTDDLVVGEGVAQAKQYAEKLKLESIYQQKQMIWRNSKNPFYKKNL